MFGIENSRKSFGIFSTPQGQRLHSCPWNISLPGSAVGGTVWAPVLDLHIVREFKKLGVVLDNIKLWTDEDVPRVQDRRQHRDGLISICWFDKGFYNIVSREYSLAASHRMLDYS